MKNCKTQGSTVAFWIAIATIFFAGTADADGPALWKISDDDNTVYLFGTFHLLPESAEWQTDRVKQAMADSPITVVETDAVSPEAMAQMQGLVMQYGVNPPGTTLSSVIGADRAASLFSIAEGFGLPSANLEPLRPWLALLSVTQAAYVSYGFNPQLGVEMILLQMAAEEGDSVEYLETLERQVTALAALEDEGLIDFVDSSLDEFDNMKTMLDKTVNAWAVGDTDTVDELVVAATREDSPRAYELIFVERNEEWIAGIEGYLAGDKDTFVAVGAGHLIGNESVIRMLEEKGLDVERIQ